MDAPEPLRTATAGAVRPPASPGRRRLLAAAWAPGLAGLAALSGCQRAPLRLAFVGGLTGRTADLGVAGRDAAQLAVEQANAAGGLAGRLLELEAFDDRQDVAQAHGVLTQLQLAGHAVAIGPMTSAMAVAMVPLANQWGITLVSPTVTTTELDGLDDQFFRVVSSTRDYARRSADFHLRRSGWRRFALVVDDGNRAYAQSWADHFTQALAERGGSVISRQTFVFRPDLSFDALAAQALAARPDAVVLIASAMDAARLAQAARLRAPAMPLLSSEWAATEQFLALGGRVVEGVHQTQYLDRESTAPAYQRFVQDFAARFGRHPGFAEAASCDATRVVLAALAGQRTGESVKQALLRMNPFQGLQQDIRFTPSGDAPRPVSITVVRNGRFVAVP